MGGVSKECMLGDKKRGAHGKVVITGIERSREQEGKRLLRSGNLQCLRVYTELYFRDSSGSG